MRATNSSFATRLVGRRSFIHASRTSPTSSRRTAIRHQSKLEETLAGSPHCRRAGPSACAAAPRRPSTRGAKIGQVPELVVCRASGAGTCPYPNQMGNGNFTFSFPNGSSLLFGADGARLPLARYPPPRAPSHHAHLLHRSARTRGPVSSFASHAHRRPHFVRHSQPWFLTKLSLIHI
mgnify:CR=1 FL=1